MEEVKILENKPFAQNHDFRRFGENFHFHGVGPILGGIGRDFFLTLEISSDFHPHSDRGSSNSVLATKSSTQSFSRSIGTST